MSECNCPDCGNAMRWYPQWREWSCEMHGIVSEQRAALDRLGPFAPPRRNTESRQHIPGFVWNGNSYTRISDPDFKQVWQDGLRAVASLRRRGEW